MPHVNRSFWTKTFRPVVKVFLVGALLLFGSAIFLMGGNKAQAAESASNDMVTITWNVAPSHFWSGDMGQVRVEQVERGSKQYIFRSDAFYMKDHKPLGFRCSNGKDYLYGEGTISFIADQDLTFRALFEGIPFETGWTWSDDGWKYINEDGTEDVNEWKEIDGSWYYFKDNGVIESNCWAWVGDAWYGFAANGAMCTGWVWDADYEDYFYCDPSGRMVKGVWDFIDGEWYGFWGNGTMCRDWVWDSSWNSWFFCYRSGVMARNTWIDGYWVNASGIWV